VVREAELLLDPNADRVAAEVLASAWLGRAWAKASLGEREPERAAARRLINHVAKHPSAAGRAALAACRLVIDQETGDELTSALPAGAVLPDWATEPTPRPIRAWIAEDPWGASQSWFIHYDDPVPHVLLASAYHPGGTQVGVLTITDPEAPAAYDATTAEQPVPSPRRPIAPARALSQLREAVRTTDMLWPRVTEAEYVENRLLAWRRIEAYAEAEPLLEERLSEDRLPDAERERLRASFVSAHGDTEGAQFLTGVFLDYGAGYLAADPLAWSPGDVLMFMLDYVPRKVVLDDADRQALVPLLADWVAFALTERGTDQRWIEPVVEAVRRHDDEMQKALDDPSGPARQFASWLEQSGIDPADTEAVELALGERNAAALARRLVTDVASTPPNGSGVQLTITLEDIEPTVWRRIVVPAGATLAELHDWVQVAMGWQDSHLHEWQVSGVRYGLADLDSDAEDESGVRLLDVAAEGDRLTYLYDFGDSWEHTVSVDAVLSPEDAGAVPRCEAGERACPPEDVGGAPGYAELVTALREPDAASEWGQMLAAAHTDFHPERFSLPTLTGAGTSRT
jgi:hypothetical protein